MNSAEYIERYQPMVSESRHQKYVAKNAEPILDKIKRKRMAKLNFQAGQEEGVKRPRLVRMDEGEFRLDPMKEGLKRELKSLFFEE